MNIDGMMHKEKHMANSDYTWNDILNGNGTLSINGGTAYSSGVYTLQTYLRNIGYSITADGQFGNNTKNAVMGFQYELDITQDGIVGQGTATRLNTVKSIGYYSVYGSRLTSSQWGRNNILAGNFDNIDLVSRIIFAEVNNNIEGQKGVGIVIKKRHSSNSSIYWESASTYPNASKWARVIGKNGQYGTTSTSCTDAKTPRRGVQGYASNNYVDPMWKNAVDTAMNMVNGYSFSATGYKVNGTTRTNTTITIPSNTSVAYYNQVAWSKYVSDYNAGLINTSVQPVTFGTNGGDVICLYL